MKQLLKHLPSNFTELRAVLTIQLQQSQITIPKGSLDELALQMADMEYCYAALNKVSRSFAVVIQQLPPELRNAVCIFYLTLRGLDTVEDDMNIALPEKLHLLRQFHLNCGNEHFKLENIGDTDDYRHLVKHYYKVARAFNKLGEQYKLVIKTITQQMGEGMAHFAEHNVITTEDYNLYCYYVAGLVGHGLSSLFSASMLEDERLKNQLLMSNAMGLMLQKTNITRDYHEDLVQGRCFWPIEIWGKYANNLKWFNQNLSQKNALTCLNEMALDALQHLPDCIQYLRLLQQKSIFRFCAIPQVMAVATLAELFNNPYVFTGVVKIRKPLAAKYMAYTNGMVDVNQFILESLSVIEAKIDSNTPLGSSAAEVVSNVKTAIHNPIPYQWESSGTTPVEQVVFF